MEPAALWSIMSEAWRKALIFAAGLLLGGVLAAWAYRTWVAPGPVSSPLVLVRVPGEPALKEPAPPAAALPAEEPGGVRTALAPVPAARTAPSADSCPFEPMVARQGPPDGRFALQAALSIRSTSNPSAFLAVAREAAAQGRPRDAEVALIASCRVAGQALGAYAEELAHAKSQLGQFYAELGSQENAAGQRAELLRRAETLFTDSVRAYSAALGSNASETRMAQQRLAAFKPADGGDAGVALDAPVPEAKCQASASARAVCADPELAQLDRDLARLGAQAASVTADAEGFRRRQKQAWSRRESTCGGNKACLRDWYAQRKRQLFNEF